MEKELITLARHKGCIVKNKEYYLWEIQLWLIKQHRFYISIDIIEAECWKQWEGVLNPHDDDELSGMFLSDYLKREYFDSYEETLEQGLLALMKLLP